MDYELYFYCLLAFCIGRISATFNLYIGYDEDKYNKATTGILLRKWS